MAVAVIVDDKEELKFSLSVLNSMGWFEQISVFILRTKPAALLRKGRNPLHIEAAITGRGRPDGGKAGEISEMEMIGEVMENHTQK